MDEHRPFIKIKSGSTEDIHYSVLYKDYPEELQRRYDKELNETPENIKRGVYKLQEIIRNEKLDNLDDKMLLAVLRSCKFNMKKAEPKLRHFIKYRREMIDKMSKIDMETVDSVFFEDSGIGVLPYRDKHGRTVVYSRPYGMDLDSYSPEDAAVCTQALILSLLTYDCTTTAGISYIGECKTPHVSTVLTVVNTFRHCATSFLAMPLRIKKIELVNEFPLVRWCAKLFSPILPSKIYKRLSFNGEGYTNLHMNYHPDMLPEEFGGTLGHLNNDFFKKPLMEFITQLKAESIRNSTRK